ncbi:hypothetical protein [Comamonas sp.]|uniref:hypothetical protein n=1 Tax=Comamonas sp. TaxID=34028 RepID=UPI0012CCC30A|nr:hypothetical protein [Comamonas sp.]MPS92925.1 hypothetical protein [Comamonas sp.]
MSEIAFAASINNLNFSLIYDHHCNSPREDNDSNIAHFYTTRNSRSGQIDNIDESITLLHDLCRQLSIDDYDDMEQFELIDALKKADPEAQYIQIEPLYKYEHSGIVYSTSPFSCPWDSGQIGYIFTTLKDFQNIGCEWNSDKAKEYILGEVELYNNYISGECFGFKIEEISTCGSCSSEHHEEIEACWGYIGERNEIIKMIAADYLDPYPTLKEKVLESI